CPRKTRWTGLTWSSWRCRTTASAGLRGSSSPIFRPGAMLMALDIAAPLAGDLPKRDDLVYFVTHPCHPSVLVGETEPEAERDCFGGVRGRRHSVCSLVQGPEDKYALGEGSHVLSTLLYSSRTAALRNRWPFSSQCFRKPCWGPA